MVPVLPDVLPGQAFCADDSQVAEPQGWRRCQSAGRNAGSTRKRFGDCGSCKGTWRRLRLGARSCTRPSGANGRVTAADGASLRRMDSLVTAAIVSVSGTVIVGVAGFGASIWNTRKTIGHARESRIWDKRAAVYIEALAAVNYRQMGREHQTRTYPMDDQARSQAQAVLATYKAPDFHELEARLQAFASEPVVTAVQLSSSANEGAYGAFQRWQSLSSTPGVASESVSAAARAVDMARRAAERADDAVVELIRSELQGRGKPLNDWRPAALPLEASKAQLEDSGT